MPAYASPAPPRTGDVAGTLRLLAYLALAIALIVLDHRGGWLSQARAQANTAIQPLWWLAGLPARLGDSVRDDAATRSQLSEENSRLRNALLVGSARQARLQVAAAENERLRGLLGTTERNRLDVQLAPILDIDLDPTRQRLILKAGSRDGVRLSQSVIDAGGLVGQIIEVTPNTATVLLITDPDHAVPVVVARNGVRLIAYGKGRSDQLDLTNIPLSGDVRIGDAIVTSGLGGRFPPGFPVGTVAALRPDDSRAFLVGELKPAAQLDRGRDVLLLRNVVVAPAPGSVAPAVSASVENNVDAASAMPQVNTATTHPAPQSPANPSTPPSTRAGRTAHPSADRPASPSPSLPGASDMPTGASKLPAAATSRDAPPPSTAEPAR